MRETRLQPAARVVLARPIVIWALALWLPVLLLLLGALWVTP